MAINMSQFDTIARPYAKAIYDLARASNTIDNWQRFLNFLAQCVSEDDFADKIAVPDFWDKFQTWVAQYVQEKDQRALSQEEKNFLCTIRNYKRIPILPNIAAQFRHFVDLAAGVCQATVYTACTLSEKDQVRIQEAITRKTGRTVVLTIKEDSSLLAGIKIEYEGWVINQSLRGRITSFIQTLDSFRN